VATTSANPGAELKIYDTSSQPLDQVLAQVQQDGASIVVGPLLKNNVEELMKSNTTLNVLALNQPEQVQNRANICYFALSRKMKPAMRRAIFTSRVNSAAAAHPAQHAGRSRGQCLCR
jgi:outer membrane PBP1 activator LpoA protein